MVNNIIPINDGSNINKSRQKDGQGYSIKLSLIICNLFIHFVSILELQ